MLWEIEIKTDPNEVDREGRRVQSEAATYGCHTVRTVHSSQIFLIQGELSEAELRSIQQFVTDHVTEQSQLRRLDQAVTLALSPDSHATQQINILYKPGMTDNTAQSTLKELQQRGLNITDVATCRRYWLNDETNPDDLKKVATKILANEAIERIVFGPLEMTSISVGQNRAFQLKSIPLQGLDEEYLLKISRENQLSLSLIEMQTIQKYFAELKRDPTDIELETIAQTWSEHCSHKTLGGRIRYTHGAETIPFENMLKETIFAATRQIRRSLGENDWCVSVFKDNAGIVTFNDKFDACIKVETHNRPSALEPYGGANTGIGGVIRDCLGTGLGGKPVANTDVFCFAPPEIPVEDVPPGLLHPKTIARGVIAGVRDYGNRMGIPTVNGAVFFDPRYIGNPLVYCGNVAIIPRGKAAKKVHPGDYIVAIGGRTGLDGIHGATFSSAVLTEESESISGGAVQIGNAITEKMVADAVLKARDLNLFTAITDCGAGGFSSAIGEMGEETGAEVWLDQAPLKYAGLTYMEIWISEAQERMILAVPPENWEQFADVSASEGVEAVILGKFTDDQKLLLKYQDEIVGELEMKFLHDGRPPVIREAIFETPAENPLQLTERLDYTATLLEILAAPNVCSKEWIIRQYDHEVQAGSVVKPLVGIANDGPADAAVIQPDLASPRGLVIANGMNPLLGDTDPFWMAAAEIDEAIRNCVAVGADPNKIAILDNFCWGNTDRPETLGTLVRAAIGCQHAAIAMGTPFISGKDSLHNEFTYTENGERRVISIPCSLLITALGQMDQITKAVTMDLKGAGNRLLIVGWTDLDFAGSHFHLVGSSSGGQIPRVDFDLARNIYHAVHQGMQQGLIESCHDLSEGGLAVAAAEMAFAGGFGAEINLKSVPIKPNLPAEYKDVAALFAESPTRLLMEITEAQSTAVESLLAGLPFAWIGVTKEQPNFQIQGHSGKPLIRASLSDLKSAWQKTIDWD